MSKQTWALDATQTPAKLDSDTAKNYNRLSFYLEQLADCLPRLTTLMYWVADDYYAKSQAIDLFVKHNRHLITRLRTDANLYYVCTKGREPGQRGRTRLYDGKVAFDDLSRWTLIGKHEIDESVNLYAQVLYSKRFKRKLAVVLLLQEERRDYVLLTSTDVEQDPTQIAFYYHLRFGIELLFRDAKQFTGLTHCQSRSDVKIDYPVNASLSTVNVARLVLAADESLHKSMNALVRRLMSQRIWQTIYDQLSLEGLVDVNRFESLKCQFWNRRAA